MIHPKLYKIDSAGKIRVWYIEREDDHYRVISGIEGGNLVTSEWTYATAKNVGKINETSPARQAEIEVESLYEKQKTRKKYSLSKMQLGKNESYFSPMLAKHFDDHRNLIQDEFDNGNYVLISPKLDGFRCLAHKHRLHTRKGEDYVSVPHIRNALIPFFNQYPNVILDGELYNHDLHDNFDKIQSLLSKKSPDFDDLKETAKTVKFYVYDIFDLDRPHMSFEERQDFLASVFDPEVTIFVADCIVPHFSTPCYTVDEIDAALGTALQEGYEGIMIRTVSSPYVQSRSKYLLKYKSFVDEEFTITKIEEGAGNWAGAAKAFWVKLEDGRECKCSPRGTKEEMTTLWEHRDEYVGKVATVRYANRTPDNMLRQGIIHHIWTGEGRDL